MKALLIPDLDSIDQAAREFVAAAGDYRIIALSGEMGAGKTTFIQAVCRALGVKEIVSSPTFALVNEYFTGEGESIYHLDLYRIEDPSELFDLGYEDYLYSGARCFIEWPELAAELIPDDALQVEIRIEADESRKIVFSERTV